MSLSFPSRLQAQTVSSLDRSKIVQLKGFFFKKKKQIYQYKIARVLPEPWEGPGE